MSAMPTLVALALVVAFPATTDAARGVLSLDSLTFDKIIDGSRPVVVKFDKQYAYGDKEDAFKAFATEMAGSTLVVAEVGVQGTHAACSVARSGAYARGTVTSASTREHTGCSQRPYTWHTAGEGWLLECPLQSLRHAQTVHFVSL